MSVPILRREDAGHVIHVRDDGNDYWRLVRACIDLHIDQDALHRANPRIMEIPVRAEGVEAMLRPLALINPKRMVFRLESEGRTYILKRAYMTSIGLRRLFPRASGTTYFTRIMNMVTAAVDAGCRSTQQYYLVAERWLSPLRQEIWVLLEYVEGHSLGHCPDFDAHRNALENAVEDLLRHDLTLDDLSLHNFLVSGETIHAIDISCRPFTGLQKAKMRVKLRHRHGLLLPAPSLWERALERALRWRYRVRAALGGKGM